MIGEELGIPFSFSVLPLVRWRLYRLGDADWVLLQVEHHFVHDGWEVRLFLKETEALYTAFLTGEESPLEPLPIQYADFRCGNGRRYAVKNSRRKSGTGSKKSAIIPTF